MAVFNKKMQEEREAEKVKEEADGVELTDEVKLERNRRRLEDHHKQIKEVDRLMQEAPQYTFNVNVFKSNIKLALSEAELKAQEDEVRDLAAFLKEKALESVVNDLKSMDNIPTDSSSLEAFFHSRGVNMRYLGQALKMVNEPV